MSARWGRAGIGGGVVAVLTLGTLDLVQHYGTGAPAALALSAVRALPLLVCRWQPVAAWWGAVGAGLVTALVTTPVSPAEPWPWAVSTVAVLAAMTGVLAARGERRQTVVAVVAVAGLGAVLAAVVRVPGGWESVATATGLCAAGAVLGHLVHARGRVRTELAEERQVSAAERARRALVEERARIARELHDVVAHHMSMITVQAETARYRLADLPEPAVAEFAGIARLARGSLAELRGLLSALRDEWDGPAFAPQPTLADLDALVERVVAAGTPVRLTVAGAVGEVSRVVQLAAYRVVQEALSNVVRHAGGAATTVSVALAEEGLVVEVANEPPPRPSGTGSGHGLVGLRERVTLLGGTLETDRPGGGWRVRATFPSREAR